MSPGAMTMCGKSPCAGWRANCKSACSVRVGRPVLGPPRCQRKTTGPGASVMAAKPKPSDITAKPGPAVDVAARTPMCAAPIAMLMLGILLLEVDAFVGRRADRVVGLHAKAGLELGDANGLKPLDQHPALSLRNRDRQEAALGLGGEVAARVSSRDRKSTRLNSSHQ